MAYLREEPYIWATWLAKILSGESSCEWAAWFRARHEGWQKASNGSFEGWQLKHTKLLSKARDRWQEREYRVQVEDQNFYRLRGRPDFEGLPRQRQAFVYVGQIIAWPLLHGAQGKRSGDKVLTITCASAYFAGMTCSSCNREAEPGSRHCTKCGVGLESIASPPFFIAVVLTAIPLASVPAILWWEATQMLDDGWLGVVLLIYMFILAGGMAGYSLILGIVSAFVWSRKKKRNVGIGILVGIGAGWVIGVASCTAVGALP